MGKKIHTALGGGCAGCSVSAFRFCMNNLNVQVDGTFSFGAEKRWRGWLADEKLPKTQWQTV